MKEQKKLDKCPFCDHIILKKNGKCPNCRKNLEELFFTPITCFNCGKKAKIENGNCSDCGISIDLPEFEYGKYIELPKKRRINLVSEREERIYQKLKSFHTGTEADEREKLLEKIGKNNKRIFLAIILISALIQILFALISMITNFFDFKGETPGYMLEPKKFIMPIFLWYTIKTIIIIGIFFISRIKPISSYLGMFVFITVTFVMETVTLPNMPLIYTLSQIITFLILCYGARVALHFDDYLTHFS